MNTKPKVEIDRSQWSRDSYQGSAEALIALGVLKPEELSPQKGRPAGTTVFLPDGAPCPPTCRAWRDPGYKTVFLCDDGDYIVEITVAREEQRARYAVVKAANAEQREQYLNKRLAEQGTPATPAAMKHGFWDWCEWWEGTKPQLQKAGIGAGLPFPDEPGAPKTVHCACPLNFAVEIDLHYDDAKAAAGIYSARSRFAPARDTWAFQIVPFAPGVVQKVRAADCTTARYAGTAECLIAATLVPCADLFPGQPGRNRQQASYRKDGTPANTSNGQDWALTIRRCGKTRFEVELPLPKDIAAQRKADYKRLEEEENAQLKVLRAERESLRMASAQSFSTEAAEEFRQDAVHSIDFGLLLLERAFHDEKSPFTFEEGVLDDLSGAFAAIRDAVHNAAVVKNPAVARRVNEQKKIVAAKTDPALQAFLRQVQDGQVQD